MARALMYLSVSLFCFLGMLWALVGWALLSTPRPSNIRECLVAQMYQVSLCEKDPTYTSLAQISPYIQHAVIVSEDASFYDHKGLDFFELRSSLETNLKEGRAVRGGSTITQQLAKNVYLSGEKTIGRKVKEAILAVQIEQMLSKGEILEKYLNVVEFGPQIFGVSQASKFYFDKTPAQVSIVEASWLAFVLPNPEKYSASFRKKELTPFARSQLRVIVERMARFKRISDAEAADALAQIESMFKPVAALEGEASPVAESLPPATPEPETEIGTGTETETIPPTPTPEENNPDQSSFR